MRTRALVLMGAIMAAALLAPWFYGTDDGRPLTIAGWDTEPGFTLGVLACACVVALAGALDRPLVAAPASVIAIGLTLWMLPRGDRYSGYDLGPGGFVELAAALIALVVAVRRPAVRQDDVQLHR